MRCRNGGGRRRRRRCRRRRRRSQRGRWVVPPMASALLGPTSRLHTKAQKKLIQNQLEESWLSNQIPPKFTRFLLNRCPLKPFCTPIPSVQMTSRVPPLSLSLDMHFSSLLSLEKAGVLLETGERYLLGATNERSILWPVCPAIPPKVPECSDPTLSLLSPLCLSLSL